MTAQPYAHRPLPVVAEDAHRARVPECHDDVCITCSDQAVAVRVTELLPGGLALVDTGQGIEEVSVGLVDATIGAVVLVHAKEAIAVVAPEDGP